VEPGPFCRILAQSEKNRNITLKKAARLVNKEIMHKKDWLIYFI